MRETFHVQSALWPALAGGALWRAFAGHVLGLPACPAVRDVLRPGAGSRVWVMDGWPGAARNGWRPTLAAGLAGDATLSAILYLRDYNTPSKIVRTVSVEPEPV
jgi:hypothetical protein